MEIVTNPLAVVERMFRVAAAPAMDAVGGDPANLGDALSEVLDDPNFAGIPQHFEQALTDPQVYASVPSLRHHRHATCPGKLVRFRCMIQDQLNPQLYHDALLVRGSDGDETVVTGRYTDDPYCGKRWSDVDGDATAQAHGAMRFRYPYHAVSIPGESPWSVAQDAAHFATPATLAADPAAAQGPTRKRRFADTDTDGDEDGDEDAGADADADADADEGAAGDPLADAHLAPVAIPDGGDDDDDLFASPEKRRRIAGEDSAAPSGLVGAVGTNLPLSASEEVGGGAAAVLMFYGPDSERKVMINHVVEVFGVLALDPLTEHVRSNHDDADDPFFESQAEWSAQHPPTSLVPTVHVLHTRPLASISPWAPLDTVPAVPDPAAARTAVLQGLVGAAGIDAVTAEYLLLTLISRVHTRLNSITLGALPLNVVGVDPASGLGSTLMGLVSELVPAASLTPLSLATLNGSLLAPCKDIHTNRLVAGRLQQAPGALMLLDETAMSEGALEANGGRNLVSLQEMIATQTVAYHFQYSEGIPPFPVDIPAVVLSEGRSCLCKAPTATVPTVVPLDPACAAAQGGPPAPPTTSTPFPETLLPTLRAYLHHARWNPVNLVEEDGTRISEDFIRIRQEMPNVGMNEELLNLWMSLARWYAASVGSPTLEWQHWDAVKALEMVRIQRVAELPTRPSQ